MSAKSEAWVCRIPRADLRAMARFPELENRCRVLCALLGELYEDYGKTGGVGEASQRELERITGLDRRTVRRELTALKADGALVQVEAKPGLTTTYRFVGAHAAPTSRAQLLRPPTGTEVRPPRTESAPTPGPNLRPPPGATAAPTWEEEELSEELLEEGAGAPGSSEPFFTSSIKVIVAKEGSSVECPKCGHGGRLDVTGGYQCNACGQLYRVRWTPLTQPARRYA